MHRVHAHGDARTSYFLVASTNMADSQAKRKATDSSDIIGSTSNNKKAKENFSWTDDEMKLLLDSVKDFKRMPEFEGVD